MYKRADLISDAYVGEQQLLHLAPRGYGQRGSKWADVVDALITEYNAGSVLDYGCGQGSLVTTLRLRRPYLRFDEYDPAIGGKERLPLFADLVVCADVLEHVEPEKLMNVLRHLQQLARKAVWVVVSLCETAKVLSDGRNAHLTIQPATWWQAQVAAAGFTVGQTPAIARQKPEKEWIAVLTS